MYNVGSIVDKTIAAACGGSSDLEIDTPAKIKVGPDAQAGAIAATFEEDSADDEMNMGLPGTFYTAADKRLLAKYIATINDWHSLEHPVRFAEFHTRVCFFFSEALVIYGLALILYPVPSKSLDVVVSILYAERDRCCLVL